MGSPRVGRPRAVTLFDQGTEATAPLPPPEAQVNRVLGPVNLVTIWLVMLMLIPSVLVVPGIGAIGTPANLFAMGMAGYWGINRIRGNDRIWRNSFEHTVTANQGSIR